MAIPTDREAGPGQLLIHCPERRAVERRRAQEIEQAMRSSRREVRRVFWQCFRLAFAGVPIYAWSWHLTDPRMAEIAVASAFFVTYALPFFRWSAFHISRSDAFP